MCLNKKWFLPLLLVCCLVPMTFPPDLAAQTIRYDYGFKPGSEPQGFRGMKWGTDMGIYDPLKKFEVVKVVGPATFYQRKDEVLWFGGARLQEILYICWDGKFSNVLLKTFGYSNFEKMREVVFAQYGRGARTRLDEQLDIQNYFWKGLVSGMFLQYNDVNKIGELGIYNLQNYKDRQLFWE